MKSHEYAEKLKAAADLLLARPEIELGTPLCAIFIYEKEAFVAAVKALGSGVKKWDDDYLHFFPGGNEALDFYIPRRSVCRLVRPAEFECDPILSDEEIATLGK